MKWNIEVNIESVVCVLCIILAAVMILTHHANNGSGFAVGAVVAGWWSR